MQTLEQIREQVDVLRAQLGDGDAFMRLVERYHNGLLHHVRRLVREHAAADDVVQETWLVAYRNLRRLRDPQSLRAWLHGIARNNALRALRKEDRSRLEFVDGDALDSVPEEDDGTLGIPAEQAAQVHRCLDQISPAHAEVLVLRHVQDLSYEEIARIVGCNVGTVRSRLHYAKRALREAMESEK